MTLPFKDVKRDFYIREKNDISDFLPRGAVLFQEDYWKHAKQLNFEGLPDLFPPELRDWYPFVNAYYPYGSCADPTERVQHLLDIKPASMPLPKPDADDDVINFPYSEKEAQLAYLQTPPLSFIILGKPGMNEEELGRKLADNWQCVYIEPQTLIEQEIVSSSRTGQCIEYNLRLGRSIGIDVVLRLVKKRVNTQSAKHRGFVICGLPLMGMYCYKEEPMISESAIFAAKYVVEDILDITFDKAKVPLTPEIVEIPPPVIPEPPVENEQDENEDENEDELDENEAEPNKEESENVFEHIELALPQEAHQAFDEPTIPVDLGEEQDICYPPEIGINYESQLNFLFDLLQPPFMMIYLICSPRDCILRRKNSLFHIYSKTEIDLVKENTNKLLYNYYSYRPEVFNEVPLDVFETYFHNVVLESKGLQHLVVLPTNFPANIEAQLDVFYHTAIHFLDRRIMTHDPEYFLKVDARTSTTRMFHIIKNRMCVLPIQKVIIPQRISYDQPLITPTAAEEGESQLLSKRQILDYQYEVLRKVGTPYEHFKWNWSDWGKKCPVSLKDNCCAIRGDPNYAVHFLNKIFFLANEDAYLKFYRNPRPYLKNLRPEKTCKFFIFGPQASGKTAVAQCLGYAFNGEVVRTGTVELDFMEEKEKEFYAEIRAKATEEGINILNNQRKVDAELAEAERIKNIKEWAAKIVDMIKHLKILLLERENELKGETKLELSSFPMAMAKVEVTALETEVSIAISSIREELGNLNLPSALEISEYEKLLVSKTKLFAFVPPYLRKKIVAEPATETDDFVIDYVNQALAGAKFLGGKELIQENMIQLVIKAIKQVEDSAREAGNIRGGWLVDGLQSDPTLVKGVCSVYMPDNVIHLKDQDDYEFLRERYKTRGANRFSDFKEFFVELGDYVAADRSPSQESDLTYKTILAKDILSEIFESPKLDGRSASGKLVRDENYYTEILKFKLQWQELEEFFFDKGIDVIDLIVTDKSIPQLLKDAIKAVEDWYRVTPSPYSDEDAAEEIMGLAAPLPEQIGEETLTDIQENIPEGAGEIEKPEAFRRYGDTFHYCPVTFSEYWVLWKGKDEFAVKFKDRVYLLSNQQNYEKFLFSPRAYLPNKPPDKIPPPRICIMGCPASGKTTLSRALANNYGIEYVSYESLVKAEFHINNNDTFENLKKSNFVDKQLRAYLHENIPLPGRFYITKLASLWFKKPIKELGFVVDDFPKRPCDVDIMIQLKLIPDIIIEFAGDELYIKNQLMHERLSEWQEHLSAYVLEKEREFQELMRDWEENLPKKFNALLEEKREERYAQKRKQKEAELEEKPLEKQASQVSFDSIADQKDIDEINRLLDITMPAFIPGPIETDDEMRTKLNAQIAVHFDSELNYIKIIRDKCILEQLPYAKMPIDENDYEKNIRFVYCITEDYKYRNNSHFESFCDVPFDLSERLLASGYCFLSKYGRLCPVEYHKQKNPFLKHPLTKKQFNIFPIIHRTFIYFIDGEENVNIFKKNPLFYVTIKRVQYPLVPLKLAVTGPPKCGKSTLANRIAEQYTMKVITRGKSVRYVLDFLPFSNLAHTMERVLRRGWEVTDEMIAKCVEAACISFRGSTQGVVFDGFPNTIIETRHLSYFGLAPHLVIDIQATKEQTLECYTYDQGRRGFPKYSVEFIKHLRREWKGYVNDFQYWFDREYQLMYKIPIDPSLWSIWYQANKIIKTVTFEIRHYFINCHKDWPLRLSYMQVTPLEFLERKSAYDSFCPCCLLLDDVLTTGGSPPDRTGLIQWRRFYYWVCNKHMKKFLRKPDTFVLPYGRSPPEHLPSVLNLKDSQPKNLYEDGYCVTCFKDNTILVKGDLRFAIYFKEKTYLFDKLECLQKFLKRPLLYCFGISFRPPDNYPGLDYKELPVLGMLEQYVAGDVIRAIQFISRRRPVIPGLSVVVSGVIGIGLHLKVSNLKLPSDYIQRYKEASEVYYSRRSKLLNYLDRMKRIINPYLHYEEPLPPFRYLASSKSSSISTYTHMTNLVEEMADNAVNIVRKQSALSGGLLD